MIPTFKFTVFKIVSKIDIGGFMKCDASLNGSFNEEEDLNKLSNYMANHPLHFINSILVKYEVDGDAINPYTSLFAMEPMRNPGEATIYLKVEYVKKRGEEIVSAEEEYEFVRSVIDALRAFIMEKKPELNDTFVKLMRIKLDEALV